ncbi:hypothetical protein QN277_018061 [Acacia crassicarpa]|uniref:LOB domain-containing protein n=1 Tax=Acacia crassicarpa TaxID=499986 RepID=A0AAE1MSC7_9FABA|nr:hypothetical protein QN277_018061 [Acacia crassicarpa]
MLGCPETERAEEIAKNTGEAVSSEAASQMGRRNFHGPAASGTTLNTVTPCAACKLLRRRCAEECPFSPYFSPHDPQKFAAVHKVFGASNVSKMLMEVAESQRADAANSLVYEANLRLRDPVYGCMGAISTLQQQVQTLQAELNAVRGEILKYKYREAASQIISSHNHHGGALVSSVEEPQPPPQPPKPPSLTSSASVVLSSLSSSSSSSVYTPPNSTISHGSISSENIPYFV